MEKKRKNKLEFWDNNLEEAEDIILRCFFPEGEEMTIKQLKKRSGYSYERVYNSLKGLVEKKIVHEKKIGKTLVYAIDFNNYYSKLAFHHYMTDRLIDFANKHPIAHRAIKELDGELLGIVLIFGSYSKGTETKDSDIDLMVILDYKSEREKAIQGLKYKYGLKIAPVFISRLEFPKIRKENPELWADLKQNALIFQGADLFYYWIYKK